MKFSLGENALGPAAPSLLNSVSEPVVVSTPKITGARLPLPTSRKLPAVGSDKVKGKTISDVIGGPAELNAPLGKILNTDREPLKLPWVHPTKSKLEEAEAATEEGGPSAANGEPGTDARVPSERILIAYTF